MPKLITFIFFSLLFLSSSNAQQKLIKKNGDTLSIKLIELNEKYVIYNKSIHTDGRIFTTSVSKFSSLIYQDGSNLLLGPENKIVIKNGKVGTIIKSPYPKLYVKQGFFWQKVYSKEKSIYSNVKQLYTMVGDKEGERLLRKGEHQNILSNIIGIPSIIILSGQLVGSIMGHKSNYRLYLASGLGTIISIWLNRISSKNIKKSVSSYNESIYTRINASNNGIGLIMEF